MLVRAYSGGRRQAYLRPAGGRMTEWYTVVEVAAQLGLSPVTVRTQFRRGRLTGRVIGRRMIFIDRSSVEQYREQSLGRPGGRRRKGTNA